MPIVSTRDGRVQGREVGGIVSYLGIDYAAAPFGTNRFRSPQPVEPWDGVRDATSYGPTAPKPPYRPPFDRLLIDPDIPGEGCLNLNIWALATASGLPVMVWVHGGAFRNGSSMLPMYDGSRFARDGVVFVSLNYRLGVDGFGYLPDAQAPANRGLLDQIAALRWVADNIAAFGGDPDQVTVFGESSGAMSIATLIAMPGARGLFHRAICQSGAGHMVSDVAGAGQVTAALAERLGTSPTAAGLSGVPIEALLEAQDAISREVIAVPDPTRWGRAAVDTGLAFTPIVDGTTLPSWPIDAMRSGAGTGIDVLTGTNTEEFRFFLVPTGELAAADTARVLGYLRAVGAGDAAEDIMKCYTVNRPGATPGDVLAAIVTDRHFVVPSYRMAQARASVGDRGTRTHMYEFAWRTPILDGVLGACHALELGFVFDTVGELNGLAGRNPPQPLADAMHGAWVAYAKTGDPGWPAWEPDSQPVMRFDAAGGRLVHDPRADERRLWDGLR